MQITVQCCDGCEKPLALKYGINTYHRIDLSFSSYMIDENTGMEEEVITMRRKSYNLYCDECFEKLVNHLDSFLDDVGNKIQNQTNTLITGDSEKIDDFAASSKKSKANYKAVEGSQPIENTPKKEE